MYTMNYKEAHAMPSNTHQKGLKPGLRAEIIKRLFAGFSASDGKTMDRLLDGLAAARVKGAKQ